MPFSVNQPQQKQRVEQRQVHGTMLSPEQNQAIPAKRPQYFSYSTRQAQPQAGRGGGSYQPQQQSRPQYSSYSAQPQRSAQQQGGRGGYQPPVRSTGNYQQPRQQPSPSQSQLPAEGSEEYNRYSASDRAEIDAQRQYMQQNNGSMQGYQDVVNARGGALPTQQRSPQGGNSPASYTKEMQTGGAPYSPPVPDVREGFYNGEDPAAMIRNDRARAAARGDMMNQELQDFRNSEDYYRQGYRARGDASYNDIAEGRGGYRPNEQEDIMGRGGLDDMQLTPEQRERLYMTEQERVENTGDPNRPEQYFDPAWYDSLNTEGNARINESTAQGAAGTREAFGRGATGLRGSMDPEALRLRGGYGNDVNSSLSGAEGNVRGILDRDRLTQSRDFVNRYRMTDRDVNDYTQSAALTQGALNRGRVGAVNRAAAATGGANPLALAAGLNNLSLTSDQQGQDAMLRARIAARGEQADREKDIEGMRLGAEGNYAGMASNAEMDLGGRRYGALRDTEGMRLNAEGGIADRNIGIESTIGARDLASEQAIADRNYDSANQQYRNNMNNARYIGETGADLARGTDDRNVERSRYASRNRQDTERYASESDYARQLARNDRISQRTQQVAAPRLSQEQEHRNYLANQQAMANENVGRTFGQQIQNNGQTGQLVQGSTGQASQYDLGRRANSFGTSFMRGLGGFMGNTLPTMAWNRYLGRSTGAQGTGGN